MTKKPSPPPKRKARILIVDDHPIAREGLAQLINEESDLTVCWQAENAEQAMQQIRADKPDLAIVDVSLRDSSGLELVKNIKAQSAGVPILVFSMHEESFFAERALQAGALGYLTKQEPTEAILVAIRRILGGGIYLSEQMTGWLLKKADGNRAGFLQSPIRVLSDRELELFQLIGRGKNPREIAASLHLSLKTIETHRSNILRKLKLKNAVELVRYACQWENNGH
jgi:DNA-binding NarL/FixJ family response regulator